MRGPTCVLFVGFTVALTGCPWGQKYPYHLAQPFVEQGRAMSIALAVDDQRVSVNAGGRPDFVGVARDGYGKTYDIATESGQPLAADFTVSIRRGLEAAGYRVTPVRVPDRSRPEIVVRQLAQTGAERLLAVRIATGPPTVITAASSTTTSPCGLSTAGDGSSAAPWFRAAM